MARTYLVGNQGLTTEPVQIGDLRAGDVFVSNLPSTGLSGYLCAVEFRDPPAGAYFTCPPDTAIDKVIEVREV